MKKPKTLEQLRAEKERAETQLAQEQHKLERLENRKRYLEKGERTKRTHRLLPHYKCVFYEETYIGLCHNHNLYHHHTLGTHSKRGVASLGRRKIYRDGLPEDHPYGTGTWRG